MMDLSLYRETLDSKAGFCECSDTQFASNTEDHLIICNTADM